MPQTSHIKNVPQTLKTLTLFHIFMRHVFQGIAYHVYDAALMFRFRKGRSDCFHKAAQPI